jgi:murein L,D-transpeptidase YafK
MRFGGEGVLMKRWCLVSLFLSFILLGPPRGYTNTIIEICEEKGIFPVRASITVIKAKRKLFFYLDERFIKTYPVVLGQNPNGQKVYEGDNCTPEGIFRVVSKRIHEKWSRFILLDYPTWEDAKRHQKACFEGLIPLRGDRCVGLGGAIGIHGNHSEDLNRAGIDWTNGCISLLNRDVEEFFPYLEEGDLVFIFP